jgi:hypothetical protein
LVGFSILQTLVQHQKPFLVFDWKRNYRDLLTRPEFRHVEVYTIGRNIAPLTFNPLIPPAGTDPKTWLKKLNEVIAHAYCLGNGVLFLLQQAGWTQCTRRPASTKTWCRAGPRSRMYY